MTSPEVDGSKKTENVDFDTSESRHSMYEEANMTGNATAAEAATDPSCEVKQLVQKEAQRIWIWKFLVVAIIVVTATLVSAGAYVFLHRAEQDSFYDNYDQFVSTIRDSSEFHASNIFVSLRSLSQTITLEATTSNQKFPFVTLPSFEVLGASVRSISGAELIIWHAIVEKSQLDEWHNYTLDNYKKNLADSRQTALTLQTEGSSVQATDFVDGDIAPMPFEVNYTDGSLLYAPGYGDGPYSPAWMVSPPMFNPSFLNTDPSQGPLKMEIAAMKQARRLVFTDAVPVQNLANTAIKADDHEAYHASLIDYAKYDSKTAFFHPHANVMVPVFEQLNDPNSKIVGDLSVVIPWDRFLTQLLPQGVSGITCVVRNSCGKAWTYMLNGNSAFYVGAGDYHDHNFNFTEVIVPFQDSMEQGQDIERVPGECTYNYYIYATQEFADQYDSNLPWALTLVVAMTFAVMIVTFVVYDVFVRRRNEKVLGHATKTNAIVSSLFPQEIKNRMMEEEERKHQKKVARTDPMHVFLSDQKKEMSSGDDTENNNLATPHKSDPIANLYPECTVYFADISGFTKWSSQREPVDVFRLLEAIYSEFDRLAKRRGVFKVETIGDCYVAITGVPEARADHAVAMTKFAWDTRETMRVVTKSLEATLGSDTGTLDMRVGLHSGPVTAGVLRGEKSRFQLFGHTVNTASRMESNGQGGKIQISPTTAECLRQAGKGHWLVPRQDKVEAKGLGVIQTYWVEGIKKAHTNLTRSSTNDNEDQEAVLAVSTTVVMEQAIVTPPKETTAPMNDAELDV